MYLRTQKNRLVYASQSRIFDGGECGEGRGGVRVSPFPLRISVLLDFLEYGGN